MITISAPLYPTDGTGAIQGYLNAYSGELILPAGHYYCPGRCSVPSGRWLHGEGQAATAITGMVDFAPGCLYGKITDMQIDWPGGGVDGLTITNGGAVGCVTRDVSYIGGDFTNDNYGQDCIMQNMNAQNSYAWTNIASHGANWYERCKLDSTTHYTGGGYYGFWQGNAVDPSIIMENHFVDCDLSGPYDWSLVFQDGYGKLQASFTGSIIGGASYVDATNWVSFVNTEIGGNVYNNVGSPMTIGSCWSPGGATGYGSGIAKANNINIA